MQFIDLKGQQQRIRPEIERRIQSVLDHGKYIMGPEVNELEERLSDYVGVSHCISCASGTDALLMALMAHDIGPGDAVFTSPFTFIATAEVIALLGATPVFVDIDQKTFNIDPDQLNLAIQAVLLNDSSLYPLPHQLNGLTAQQLNGPLPHQLNGSTAQQLTPRVIIPVDLFGLPADYDRINSVVSSYNEERRTKHDEQMVVIEDAAQSLGAEDKDRMAGNLADIACTSFFPAKPLGCYGDGGAIFTDSDDLAETMRSIRVHGKGSHKYDNARTGINGRLDTLQAAILLAKLDIFPEEIELRQQVAKRYSDLLSPLSSALSRETVPEELPERGFTGIVRPPFITAGYKSAWAQYSVLAEQAAAKANMQNALKEEGIPTAVYYPKPLHLQTAFQDLGYKTGDFPVSEDASKRIFSLPMHPYVTEQDQVKIANVLKKVG